MSERRLNPQTLAERLDALIPPGQLDVPTTSDDPLVAAAVRVAALPQPEPMRPEVKARIRADLLNAYHQQMVDAPASSHNIPARWWIAAGVVGVVVLVVVLILTRGSQDAARPSPDTIPTPILTGTGATVPDTPTPLEVIPTLVTLTVITPTPSMTATPTASVTPAATTPIPTTPAPTTPTPGEITPEVTPPVDSFLPTTLVIEGPITAINGNLITVFGIRITVDPNNRLLTLLRVGDVVRIEGDIVDTGGTPIIAAVHITARVDQVITNPPGMPPAIPPGCKITGMGSNNPRLKCSGKSSRRS